MKSTRPLTQTITKALPTSEDLYARTIRRGGAKSTDNKHSWDTYMINGKIRRLTPTETERLMSWPDGHTKYGINDKGEKIEISDSQRYKMCGNGVVSDVVASVVENILIKE